MHMEYVFGIAMLGLNLLWLSLVVFSLPGNWLMVATVIAFNYYQGSAHVYSGVTVAVIVALALLAEVIEFVAGMGGAKKAGASFLGAIAAVIGAILGAIVGTMLVPVPIIGTLLGSCFGAGLGTLSVEKLKGKTFKDSLKGGLGASKGQLFGVVSKLTIGFIIWIIIAVGLFV